MAALVSSEANFPTAQAVNSEESAESAVLLPEGRDEAIAGTIYDENPTDDLTKSHTDNTTGDPDQNMDEAGFDIIGVHGLHGDEKTWRMPSKADSPDSTWLDKLFSEIAPKGGSFFPYNYNSEENSMECYTVHDINRSAQKLLEEIAKHRTPEIKNTGRPIYFACHDIGGVIVKAAIILANLDESTYADILRCIRGIIFFGYPHRAHTTVDLEEQLFWLLSLNNDRYRRGQTVTFAKSLAETISKVNDSFIHTKMLIQARIVNIFSTNDDPAKRVFDKFTATLGVAFEYQVPSVKPHLQLTDAGELDSYASAISPDKTWLSSTESHNASLRKSLHQASPIYPALDDDTVECTSELDVLYKSDDNRILHIHCTSDADRTTESVKNYLCEQKGVKGKMYYFRFRSHDVRFNNIPAMLWTFFAHLGSNRPNMIDSYFPNVYDDDPWEYQCLLHLWRSAMIRDDDPSRLLVLGCVDECDDSVLRFLSEIRKFFMAIECRLRIIIITTTGTTEDKLIVKALSEFPTESIAHIDYNLPGSVPDHIGFNASMLLQENLNVFNGLRIDIEAMISGCPNDESLRRLLIKWLASAQNPSESVSCILAKSQTPSLEIIVESILAEVPEKCHLWAQQMLSWMLSSFRPLRESEFCRISDLCLGSEGDSFHTLTGGSAIRGRFANIIRHFGGLLVAVHGEVDFSHPSMRSWLKSLDPKEDLPLSKQKWYQQTERDRQMTIMQTCLKHLRNDTDSTQVWAAQLPYATQFWVSHYKQVGPIEDVMETIFQHQSRLERWIDAYMALPAPFLKPLKTSRKLLPIASHFGLEAIVKSIFKNNQFDIELLGQGLIEATRAAQLPTFRLLIDQYSDGLDLSDEYVQDSLCAAICSENYELCRELVNHIHLPESHELRQRQPGEQYPGMLASDADGANNGPKLENPEKITHKDENTTEKVATPQNSNDLSSYLLNALCLACELGMSDIVARLLSFGLDIDDAFLKGISRHGYTPLEIASKNSRLDSVKLLIAAGAGLAPSDDRKTTPLELAALHGSGDVTSLLLSHGAQIDTRNESGFTPLQVACVWGNFAAAESLLQHRNFQEYTHITPDLPSPPLIIAVRHGHYKVTNALLHHGADPNLPDSDGETALYVAIMAGETNICRLLLAHKADPNTAIIHDQWKSTPLLAAVSRNDLDMIKLLVENDSDVNQSVDEQRTPVYMATLSEQIEIVRYLLSRNADPNLAKPNGVTPLWLAAQQGSSEIVQLLVEAKADIHAYDEDEWTALHGVSDSAETVRILLEYGADINKTSKDGHTPLGLAILNNQSHATKEMLSVSKIKPDWSPASVQKAMRHAVLDGYTEVVSLMLEAGANVDLVDDENASLIALAMPLNDDSMIRTLLEYGADLSIKDNDGDTILHYIGKDTPVQSVRRVLNAGGKLDALNKEFETPLISSIVACNMEVFTYLMTKKLVADTLNIAYFSKEGGPLHFACAQGTIEMVKVLVKNGADVNYTCTSAYGTPLIAATRRWEQQRKDIPTVVRLLLDEGADPTISSGISGYPIITASISCSTEVLQMFLDHKALVDVKDPFGRKPVHFACYNTLEVLNFLNLPDSDFAARDAVGRVPLHYAVLRGQLDLLEEVLTRSQRVGIDIDVLDDDDWTPLLWAARVSRIIFWDEKLQPSQYDAVVSFLLNKGANPSIRGRGLYKDWTVSEVAYYHHADSIADSVEEKSLPMKKVPKSKKRGKLVDGIFCYCCRLEMSGIYFQRADTRYIRLCFKCYRSKTRIAPHDKFEEYGYESDSGDEAPDAAQSKPTNPQNGEDAVNETENAEIQFDDEIVEEEDMEL